MGETKTQIMALSETQWQQLVAYKDARIKALEDRVNTLEHLRDSALEGWESSLQAHIDTMDFINSKLYTNG